MADVEQVHGNDSRLKRCGFAKLIGTSNNEPLEYYIAKYEIVLGRNSKSSFVDVVLGSLRRICLRRLLHHCCMFVYVCISESNFVGVSTAVLPWGRTRGKRAILRECL